MISVIIPVYNVSPYIERCVRSIFEQTYQDWEAIFVDDGSPDDSVKILEQVIQDYPNVKNRVRILHHDHNRGLAAARNTALDAAQGEFVIHVDSDDWLESIALEVLAKKQKESNADIVSGTAVRHDQGSEELKKDSEFTDKDDFMLKMIEFSSHHEIWRRLIRTSLYKNNNIRCVEGIDIGEDYYTLPKLIYYAKKCAELDKVVYHYNYQTPNSYMARFAHTENFTKVNSDLASTNVLIDFFKDRSTPCTLRLQEIKAGLILRRMILCCKASQKKEYKMLAKELYNMPYNCITSAGLGNIWPRLVYRTYEGLALYHKLKSLLIRK